jgi:gluconate kinase
VTERRPAALSEDERGSWIDAVEKRRCGLAFGGQAEIVKCSALRAQDHLPIS